MSDGCAKDSLCLRHAAAEAAKEIGGNSMSCVCPLKIFAEDESAGRHLAADLRILARTLQEAGG